MNIYPVHTVFDVLVGKNPNPETGKSLIVVYPHDIHQNITSGPTDFPQAFDYTARNELNALKRYAEICR